MSLFQPSQKAVSAVITEICDTVGASGDAEMQARAQRSLNAAILHFNNRANWDFLLTEATPIGVYAPFSVSAITASGGVASAAAPGGHGILVDDFLSGSGFGAGIRCTATAASGIGFSLAITGYSAGTQVITVSAERDMYDLPSDFKAIYSGRLLGAFRALRYVGRRLYDRSVTNEQQTSSIWWYDLFTVGGKGKIRLLPPPPSADSLQIKYFRRMATATSVSDSATLDIKQDYEPYLIAYAKWHFLVDKGEGRAEQGKTWYALSQEGLTTMMKDQTRVPDEDVRFVPGHYNYGNLGDNVTRGIPWDFSAY